MTIFMAWIHIKIPCSPDALPEGGQSMDGVWGVVPAALGDARQVALQRFQVEHHPVFRPAVQDAAVARALLLHRVDTCRLRQE